MNDAAMTPVGANPFSARAVLVLVVFGAAVFIALLWMIGAGMGARPANDGGNHAEARGLNGFAAFSRFLEKQGYDVERSRSDAAFEHDGLLVLTPPHFADGDEISRIIQRRRGEGPTLLVLPKWNAIKLPAQMKTDEMGEGWVMLGPPMPIRWEDDVDAVGPLDTKSAGLTARASRWSGFGLSGVMPDSTAVQTISSGRIIPLVQTAGGQTLAGYLDDGGHYDRLAAAAQEQREHVRGSELYPVLVVADPDLLDNYGFARKENALLARALVAAATDGERMAVTFDLTLNGHARSANLLTLAFTPPFLAATLCLLMAVLAVGWRAFLRFGPANKTERAIAFGKTALVANVAGFVRRTRRLHLVAGPYADSARERIVKALALPRETDSAATDAAIDRALKARAPGSQPFSQVAATLRAAHNRHDAVKAAQDLHDLERMLIR